MPGRILVVDDDVDFRDALAIALTARGYTVSCASSGDEGLAAMRAQRPDLVVLDVMMTWVLDGLRLSLEMKKDPSLAAVPVVMVSSIGSSAYAAAFPADQPLDVAAFITKPVQIDHLVRELEKLLASRVTVQLRGG